MEYSGTCENHTCAFFPTERYTVDEIQQIVSGHNLANESLCEDPEPELLSGRNISKSILIFLINLPEAHNDIQRGLEWIQIMSETAQFEQKELYITICPGCNRVSFSQW